MIGIINVTFLGFVACGTKSTTAESETQDQQTVATNLKMATKLIQAAIQSGQWDIKLLDNMNKRLAAIEARIATDPASMKADASIGKIILEADKAVSDMNTDTKATSLADYQSKYTQAKDSLGRIKTNLGVASAVSAESLIEDMAKMDKQLKVAQDANKLPVSIFNDARVVVDKVSKAILNKDVELDQDLANAVLSLDMQLENASVLVLRNKEVHAVAKDVIKVLRDLETKVGIISEASESIAAASRDAQDNGLAAAAERGYKALPAIKKFVDAQNGSASAKSSSTPSTSNVNVSQKGIKTRYGTHDYGCKTQAEYDKAMAILDKVVGNYDYINKNSLAWKMHEAYKKGVRYTAYQKGTDEYSILYHTQKSQGVFFAVTNPKYYDIAFIVPAWDTTLSKGCSDPGDGTPRSLYDVLVRKVTDCDAGSQLQSAIYDKLGFNTKVMASTNHAWCVAQIDGKWWNVEGSSFVPANPNGGEQISGETFK